MEIFLAQHILLVFGDKDMSEQNGDDVFSQIEKEFRELSHTPFKPRIFKVDDLLRKENEKGYDPVMVAIGPYHHGNHHLKMMEEQKLRYLRQLQQRNESSVKTCVAKLRTLEEEARSYYAERPEGDEFVKMMLLDSCFIIELFRKFKKKELVDEDDSIFKMDRIINVLQRDLLLLENQLPFFILRALFDMTKPAGDVDDVVDLALSFLGNKLPNPFYNPSTLGKDVSSVEFDHLLGLVHHICTQPSSKMVTVANEPSPEMVTVANDTKQGGGPFIRCTVKLQRVGIRFRSCCDFSSPFDIKFKDGAMTIPHLIVNDDTQCFFRNLIAYEQYHHNLVLNYFTDYAKLMDCLINSAEDVEQLRENKIIENRLGCDESMSDMFNKLCRNVTFNPTTFYYSSLFEEVRKYSESTKEAFFRINLWKIKARRYEGELWYHLRNPVTVISLNIACVGVLLALVQLIVRLHLISR